MFLFAAHYFFNGKNLLKMTEKENFYYINYENKFTYSLICNNSKQIEIANLTFYNGIILLNKNENFINLNLIKEHLLTQANENNFLDTITKTYEKFLSGNTNYSEFLLIENINLSNFKYDNKLIIRKLI